MTNPIATPNLDDDQTLPSVVTGPRKLVRPRLPEGTLSSRRHARRQPDPLLAHQDLGITSYAQHGSHAELFYFQKQVQAQTLMVFVLEDGERIEGVIEWCDLHVIKVRHTTRCMIYKSSIKYLYKATEAHAAANAPRPRI